MSFREHVAQVRDARAGRYMASTQSRRWWRRVRSENGRGETPTAWGAGRQSASRWYRRLRQRVARVRCLRRYYRCLRFPSAYAIPAAVECAGLRQCYPRGAPAALKCAHARSGRQVAPRPLPAASGAAAAAMRYMPRAMPFLRYARPSASGVKCKPESCVGGECARSRSCA